MGGDDGNRTGRFVEVRRVAETGSTNRDLLDAAAAGAPDGTVLVAAHQTAGRGRLDRSWSAPPGGSLLVSVLLRPVVPPDRLFLLTVACGMAALGAVTDVTGVELGLKWPNDLVAGGRSDRKVGGILAESVLADDRVDAVVVGMGLNVDWPEPLPEELAAIATSLDRLAGGPVGVDAVFEAWLARYAAELDALDAGGAADLMARARARSATIGRRVEVVLPSGTFAGRAIGVTDDGHLVVEPDGGGDAFEVTMGDVVHARLAD